MAVFSVSATAVSKLIYDRHINDYSKYRQVRTTNVSHIIFNIKAYNGVSIRRPYKGGLNWRNKLIYMKVYNSLIHKAWSVCLMSDYLILL